MKPALVALFNTVTCSFLPTVPVPYRTYMYLIKAPPPSNTL